MRSTAWWLPAGAPCRTGCRPRSIRGIVAGGAIRRGHRIVRVLAREVGAGRLWHSRQRAGTGLFRMLLAFPEAWGSWHETHPICTGLCLNFTVARAAVSVRWQSAQSAFPSLTRVPFWLDA